MYHKIINPITYKKVSVHSSIGKKIIKNYIKYLMSGGAGAQTTTQTTTLTTTQKRVLRDQLETQLMLWTQGHLALSPDQLEKIEKDLKELYDDTTIGPGNEGRMVAEAPVTTRTPGMHVAQVVQASDTQGAADDAMESSPTENQLKRPPPVDSGETGNITDRGGEFTSRETTNQLLHEMQEASPSPRSPTANTARNLTYGMIPNM